MKKTLGRIYILIIMLFLYLPIFALIVLSFNESKSMSVWGGFSLRWYQQELADLSIDRKIRLVPYLWRTRKTTVPQMARTLGLRRQQISDILHIACGKRRGRIS